MPETNIHKLSQRQFILGSIILLVFAAYYLLPVCFVLRGNTDQGLIPLGADLILRGKLIHKDIWTVVFPGSYLWLALWLKLFGESWIVAKGVLYLSLLCMTALLLALSRRLIESLLVFLPAAILVIAGAPPWGCNYYQWDALLAFLATTFLLSKVLDQCNSATPRTFILAFSAGITAGLAICCMQSLAPVVIAGLATSAYLFARGSGSISGKTLVKIFSAEIIGLGLVLASLLTYLVLTHSLNDFVNAAITFTLNNYESVNREPYGSCHFFDLAVLSSSWMPDHELLYLVQFIIGGLAWFPYELVKDSPFCLMIAILVYKLKGGLIDKAISANPQVILFLVLGFGFWLVELHRADINRLLWGSQLLMILLLYFAECAYKQIPQLRLTITIFASISVLGLCVLTLLTSALYKQPKTTLKTRWGNIATLDDLRIIEVIQTLSKPYDKVLVYPYDTTINFLSRTSFPSVHPLLQYRFNTKEQMVSTIDDMEKHKVEYVAWDISRNNQTFPDLGYSSYTPVEQGELIIEPYLISHYDFVKQYGRFRLMKRKADRLPKP